jgi:hypothetical protein
VFPETISNQLKENNYLFYKISDHSGVILKYFVVDVYQEQAVKLSKADLENNELSVSYKGYTEVYNIESR